MTLSLALTGTVLTERCHGHLDGRRLQRRAAEHKGDEIFSFPEEQMEERLGEGRGEDQGAAFP